MTPEEQMTISALRYALGRSSYIVGDTIQWVKSMKNRGNHFNVIAKRDIEEQLTKYPDTYMAEEWKELAEFLTPLMNKIHQWLEGKKKPCHSTDTDDVLERKMGRNECIHELQADSPSLLSTMEAEIRGRIGENVLCMSKSKLDKRAIIAINEERSRIHTIIHSYFNPQE